MKLYNGRIIHLEDLLFEGSDGLNTIFSTYSDLTRTVQGSAHEDFQISMKIDGSPSIIFGKHPETEKFFVSTKSLFNKEPKVNYTYEDIERNHPDSRGLQHTLNACLDYLPETDKIVQADVLYSNMEYWHQDINEKTYFMFQPNTIAYGIPVDTALYENVIKSDLGFIYHTIYQNDLLVENATMDTSQLDFTDTPNVWCRDASITVDPDTLTKEETQSVIEMDDFLYRCISNHDLAQLVHIIPKKQYLQKLLYSYVYECVKGNSKILHAPGLCGHIMKVYEDRALACTTDAGKKNNYDMAKEIIRDIKSFKEMPTLLSLWNELAIHKETCLMPIFQKTPFSLETFLYDEKYIPCKPEGYVLNRDYTVKIVDRFEFTKANYENQKWK